MAFIAFRLACVANFRWVIQILF